MAPQELNQLLARKEQLESRAAADVELSGRLDTLRLWQAQRLERTYGGLRREPRFIAALDFFLTDLYGPQDFSRRDADLKRAVGKLQRALPGRLIALLGTALQLQVLTLELDQATAASLESHDIDTGSYAAAYRRVGRVEDRQRQIDLLVRIGQELGAIVRQRWIGIALRAAHSPAHIAGFGVLQGFLERGFAAFGRMGDPTELMEIIRERETALMTALLSGDNSLL
jgi:hypothetical protein